MSPAALRARPRLRGESGVTLIEALIAMVVLTIGMLGLFVLHNTALRSNQQAFRITISTMLAQDGMEYLLSREFTPDSQDPLLIADGTVDATSPSDPLVDLPRELPGEVASRVNAMGGSDANYGSPVYRRTYHVANLEADGSRIQILVRVSFQDPVSGLLHGVTLTQTRSFDTYSPGAS